MLARTLFSVICNDRIKPIEKLVLIQNAIHRIKSLKENQKSGSCAVDIINLTEEPASNSALIHAAMRPGHEHILAVLIRAGANLNLQNRRKQTALFCAVSNNHLANVNKLLQSGADPEMTDEAGKTAMDIAVMNANFSIIRTLLAYRAEVRNPEAFKKLFDSLPDSKQENKAQGHMPDDIDMQRDFNQSNKFCLRLQEHQTKEPELYNLPGEKQGNSSTPLVEAVRHNKPTVAAELLTTDETLDTNQAMDQAICKNNIDMVCLLLRHGAQIRNTKAFENFLDAQKNPELENQVTFCRNIHTLQKRKKAADTKLVNIMKNDNLSSQARLAQFQKTAIKIQKINQSIKEITQKPKENDETSLMALLAASRDYSSEADQIAAAETSPTQRSPLVPASSPPKLPLFGSFLALPSIGRAQSASPRNKNQENQPTSNTTTTTLPPENNNKVVLHTKSFR